MEVIFKHSWIAPGPRRFRHSPEPQFVPDGWKDILPSSAQVVTEVSEADNEMIAASFEDPPDLDNLGKDALDATAAFKAALRAEGEDQTNTESSAAHAAQNAAAEADKAKAKAKKEEKK